MQFCSFAGDFVFGGKRSFPEKMKSGVLIIPRLLSHVHWLP